MAGRKLNFLVMNVINFLVMNVILLIVFLGFINIISDLHRFLFIAEFLFMGVLILVALVSMVSVYNNIKFGWTLMSFVLTLVLIDLFFIYLLGSKSTLLLLTAVVGLVGFIVSVVNISGNEVVEEEAVKEAGPRVKKEFKPGKYVASKTGSKFHSPKCDWAKKIKKANAVWFNSEEEAKKAGYKVDDCVKQKVYKNF